MAMIHPLRLLRVWLRRRAASRLSRPFGPRLEVLEDRLAPAASFGPLIGLDAAKAAYPYRGTGYTVAVLDSGIDYNHPDLGGGWGKRVIAGYDFVNNDTDPMDDYGHGTHIAGIIGGSGATYPGVAPDVNFVALKVLDANNNGTWDNVDRALRWVIDHRAEYNIVDVNLSMSGGNYASNPSTFLENDFSTLKAQGVFLSLSSGNSFYTFNSQPGLGYPSISDKVVSVGAVWTADIGRVNFASGATDYTTAPDRIMSLTQRGPSLSLLAPGAWITSTWKDGGYQVMGGTSMAAAVVSGAAVLMHQALDAKGQQAQATQDTILGLMKQTGATIIDGDDENDNVVNTGLSFKRLNLKAALDAIGLPSTPPVWTPISPRAMSHAQDTMWVALSATDPQGLPVTYSARVLPINGQIPPVTLRLSGKYLTIDPDRSFAGTFTIEVTASDGQASSTQTFTVRVWNYAPQLTKPANVTLTQGTSMTMTLTARDPDGDTVDYSARVLTGAGQTAPATVRVQGNQLTITPLSSFAGTFTIEVTASDGAAASVQSFGVTVTSAANTPPTLSAIPTQTLAAGQSLRTLTLSGADADGDALTYAAVPQAPSATAYQVDQQLGLGQFNGTYYPNLWGQGEKWLIGTGGIWYALLPDGGLYRWTGSMSTTLQSANRVATFDAQVYAEPRLLWQALPPTTTLTASVAGNQLTLTRPAGLLGVFLVEASVRDGSATASRTFMVVMN